MTIMTIMKTKMLTMIMAMMLSMIMAMMTTIMMPITITKMNICRLYDWSTRLVTVRLDRSHLEATMRIQTVELGRRSQFSYPVTIFRYSTIQYSA